MFIDNKIVKKLHERANLLEYLLENNPDVDDFSRGVNAQRREELTMLKELLK